MSEEMTITKCQEKKCKRLVKRYTFSKGKQVSYYICGITRRIPTGAFCPLENTKANEYKEQKLNEHLQSMTPEVPE